MSYEIVVGLQVIDDVSYSKYRHAMTPILERFGGGFRYDFKISDTLKNEGGRPINRVFTIHFRDKENMDNFFSNSEYIEVKKMYFEKSVQETTIMAEYNRN